MKLTSVKDFMNEHYRVDEKTKTLGGNGYWESFSETPEYEKVLKDLYKSVKRFMDDSKDYQEDEELSDKEQKELIVDDILDGINKIISKIK